MTDAKQFPAPDLGAVILAAIAGAAGRVVIRSSVYTELGDYIEVTAVLQMVGHAAVLDGAATLAVICAAIRQATGFAATASPASVALCDCIQVTAWLQNDGSLIVTICDPSQAGEVRG